MSKTRKIQVWLLILAGTVPSVANLPSFFLGVNPFFPRQLRIWSVFPAPLVFVDQLYVVSRTLELHFPGGALESWGPRDAYLRNTGFTKHWQGATIWHFLKNSPNWPDVAVTMAMDTFLCKNAPAFGALSAQGLLPESVVYKIGEPPAARVLSVACARP